MNTDIAKPRALTSYAKQRNRAMGMKRTVAGGEIVQVQGGHIVRPTGKKDHHSKVFTARGPRDRRVRLSAATAIQLYDVQDRLGFDRPSKAVDWLINKAQSAIDKLARLPPAVVSGDSSGYNFNAYPPDIIHRNTDKDLSLSLQSFQDSTNQDQITLFTGDGGGSAFTGAAFQSWLVSSQRGPFQSSFAEPSSIRASEDIPVTSSDHRSRFGLLEFCLPPQIHGQDEYCVASGNPSSAPSPSSDH